MSILSSRRDRAMPDLLPGRAYATRANRSDTGLTREYARRTNTGSPPETGHGASSLKANS